MGDLLLSSEMRELGVTLLVFTEIYDGLQDPEPHYVLQWGPIPGDGVEIGRHEK